MSLNATKQVLNPYRYLLLAVAMLISSVSNAVVLDEKDWRQLTETLGFSYDSLSDPSDGVCSAVTGACSGSLNGVDFSGWTWASMAEVGELFNLLADAVGVDFSNPAGASLQEYDSVWGPIAIDRDGAAGSDTGYFLATSIIPGQAAFLKGLTRTESIYNASNAFMPVLLDEFNPGVTDDAATTTHGAKWLASQERGVWLYRTPTPVPIPSTLWLFVPAFGLMIRRLCCRIRSR